MWTLDLGLYVPLCLLFFEVVRVDWHLDELSARHRYTERRRWDLRTGEFHGVQSPTPKEGSHGSQFHSQVPSATRFDTPWVTS